MNPIIDESDIDANGNGTGPELGCLSCHETTITRWGMTPTYLLAALDCGECQTPIIEVWV
ncbi:MAG: hypothetical protein PHC88_05440 [Terrimicrobiaceae bacterium]|nr:hypothetical protein [Terrimicrobiaceae bacterium]